MYWLDHYILLKKISYKQASKLPLMSEYSDAESMEIKTHIENK